MLADSRVPTSSEKVPQPRPYSRAFSLTPAPSSPHLHPFASKPTRISRVSLLTVRPLLLCKPRLDCCHPLVLCSLHPSYYYCKGRPRFPPDAEVVCIFEYLRWTIRSSKNILLHLFTSMDSEKVETDGFSSIASPSLRCPPPTRAPRPRHSCVYDLWRGLTARSPSRDGPPPIAHVLETVSGRSCSRSVASRALMHQNSSCWQQARPRMPNSTPTASRSPAWKAA